MGNGPKMLQDITMVGNDLELHQGGTGACGKGGQSVPCRLRTALVPGEGTHRGRRHVLIMRRKIMNKEMLDLVTWVIKATKSAGADDCKVNLDSDRSVEISYRDRRPENIKEASTKALNIEVYVNNRFSVQSTSDLRKGALQDFITNAVAATKLLAEDPQRSLPDPKYYQGRSET